MFGSIGSISAQTSNESAQDASSCGNVDGNVITVAGIINGLPAPNYAVVHMWKPTAPGSPTHHSHIQITDLNAVSLFHFGLFNVGANTAGIVYGHGHAPSSTGYRMSTSYKPNPVRATPVQILAAYNTAVNKCGGTYNLLHNNCQKFARVFMTALGAKHYRKFWHL